MIRHITCIRCPMGCYLTVRLEEGKEPDVFGNQCRLGVQYARTECTNPTRMLTSTVRLENARQLAMAPVKSAAPLPKHRVMECARALKNIRVRPPLRVSDIIVENICNTGVDIICTRDIADNNERAGMAFGQNNPTQKVRKRNEV